MIQVINAIFEQGVFKPIYPIQMKEHERVTIKIVSQDDWQERFNRVIEKIHINTGSYNSEEIEDDISQAINEVRKG
jgi:predicted DNA-binding antitoxin AbrB/MazE fold protein